MVEVLIHNQDTADDSFADTAANAIDSYLAPEVNFSLDAWVYSYYFTTDGGSWSEVQNDFNSYLQGNGLDDDTDTINVCIIDEPFDVFGAGIKWTKMNYADPYSGTCGVNGACKFYTNSYCAGTGKYAYMNTVIHEVGHTLQSYHEDGSIYTDRSSSPVSPMQTWYSANNCASNDPVASNCFGNADSLRYEYARDPTGCATNAMEYWVSNS